MKGDYVKDKSGNPYKKNGFNVTLEDGFTAILKDEFAPGLPATDLISQRQVNDFLRVFITTKTAGVTHDFTPYTLTNHSIVAGQLLVILNGDVTPYNALNAAHADLLIGIAINSASIGNVVNVQAEGLVSIVGLGLIHDVVYFAGPNGSLVMSDDGMAFSQIIGNARSDHELYYQPQAIYMLQ